MSKAVTISGVLFAVSLIWMIIMIVLVKKVKEEQSTLEKEVTIAEKEMSRLDATVQRSNVLELQKIIKEKGDKLQTVKTSVSTRTNVMYAAIACSIVFLLVFGGLMIAGLGKQ